MSSGGGGGRGKEPANWRKRHFSEKIYFLYSLILFMYANFVEKLVTLLLSSGSNALCEQGLRNMYPHHLWLKYSKITIYFYTSTFSIDKVQEKSSQHPYTQSAEPAFQLSPASVNYIKDKIH